MKDGRKVVVLPLAQRMTIQTNKTTTETYFQLDLEGTESWGAPIRGPPWSRVWLERTPPKPGCTVDPATRTWEHSWRTP